MERLRGKFGTWWRKMNCLCIHTGAQTVFNVPNIVLSYNLPNYISYVKSVTFIIIGYDIRTYGVGNLRLE